jgi:hypothetical protein
VDALGYGDRQAAETVAAGASWLCFGSSETPLSMLSAGRVVSRLLFIILSYGAVVLG